LKLCVRERGETKGRRQGREKAEARVRGKACRIAHTHTHAMHTHLPPPTLMLTNTSEITKIKFIKTIFFNSTALFHYDFFQVMDDEMDYKYDLTYTSNARHNTVLL